MKWWRSQIWSTKGASKALGVPHYALCKVCPQGKGSGLAQLLANCGQQGRHGLISFRVHYPYFYGLRLTVVRAEECKMWCVSMKCDEKCWRAGIEDIKDTYDRAECVSE